MTLIIKEHNVETGKIIDREMNAEELLRYENDQAEAEVIATKKVEVKAAKAEAEAKLAALHLTVDDLKALGL